MPTLYWGLTRPTDPPQQGDPVFHPSHTHKQNSFTFCRIYMLIKAFTYTLMYNPLCNPVFINIRYST